MLSASKWSHMGHKKTIEKMAAIHAESKNDEETTACRCNMVEE